MSNTKANKNKKTRRSFLNILLGSTTFAFISATILPVWKFLIPPASNEANPTRVIVGNVDDLKPNSGKIFKFGKIPGIIIKTTDGEIKAFTATCTHLSCIVQYRPDFEHIWCACHNGHYDLTGRNIAGPPPRALTPFKVNINGDDVIVSK